MSTKLDRDYVAERLRDAEAEIRALGVRRLALFGSFARGEAGDDSDVDFLVEFEPGQKSFDRFLDLAELLERAVGRRVDLLPRNRSLPTSARTSWPRRRMSFEPLDYLRHILGETEYLVRSQ